MVLGTVREGAKEGNGIGLSLWDRRYRIENDLENQ